MVERRAQAVTFFFRALAVDFLLRFVLGLGGDVLQPQYIELRGVAAPAPPGQAQHARIIRAAYRQSEGRALFAQPGEHAFQRGGVGGAERVLDVGDAGDGGQAERAAKPVAIGQRAVGRKTAIIAGHGGEERLQPRDIVPCLPPAEKTGEAAEKTG